MAFISYIDRLGSVLQTAFAEGEGIAVLDLLPYFSGFSGPELWVHPTNQHPNEQAHAVAARALSRFLLDLRSAEQP